MLEADYMEFEAVDRQMQRLAATDGALKHYQQMIRRCRQLNQFEFRSKERVRQQRAAKLERAGDIEGAARLRLPRKRRGERQVRKFQQLIDRRMYYLHRVAVARLQVNERKKIL